MNNAERIEIGGKTFKAFCKAADVTGVEAEQDYSIGDAIANLLHYAHSKGFDPEQLANSAMNHFTCETKGIDCCPECGSDFDCDCDADDEQPEEEPKLQTLKEWEKSVKAWATYEQCAVCKQKRVVCCTFGSQNGPTCRACCKDHGKYVLQKPQQQTLL